MSIHIDRPTLLLHVARVKHNIQRMSEKAQSQGIRFRPHFKTHQSATIGDWFREMGVTSITVSSVEMAQYFASHGWDDITIAFPINLRQMNAINELARSIRLGILVESVEAVDYLSSKLTESVDAWIEVDEGSHRSGVAWEHPETALLLAKAIQSNSLLRFKGILTHAGRIYRGGSTGEIQRIYSETIYRMNTVRQYLAAENFHAEIWTGDTTGCTLSSDLGIVYEIRPGNFVFFDAQQLKMGVCTLQDIAAVVACPVVAKYPERGEVVIYGGAVHLSKDTVSVDNHNIHGLVVNTNGESGVDPIQEWLTLVDEAYVVRLTQEHGVVTLPKIEINQVKIGDCIYIIPAHVCLTVSALGEYLTTEGQVIPTMNLSRLHHIGG